MLTRSEILERGAALIERDGHWKGEQDCPQDLRGSRNCIMTALCVVTNHQFFVGRDAALSALRGLVGEFIAMYSDNTPTDEVIAAMRAVAATERAREARLMPVVVKPIQEAVYV